jgi:hypothetical protein
MTDILVNRSLENEEDFNIHQNILNESEVSLNDIINLEKDEHIIEDHRNSEFSSVSLPFTNSILLTEYFKLKFQVFIFLHFS